MGLNMGARQQRLPLDQRKQMILNATVKIIESRGWEAVTGENIRKKADIAKGTIWFAFGSMEFLHDELYGYAIKNPSDNVMLKIIAHGLAKGNAVAKSATDEIKRAALATLY